MATAALIPLSRTVRRAASLDGVRASVIFVSMLGDGRP
jgi:hypothetical protein